MHRPLERKIQNIRSQAFYLSHKLFRQQWCSLVIWLVNTQVILLLLSSVRPFATPWTVTCQASLSFTVSWSLLKLMPIESEMPSNYLITCTPFSSCLQSFPASESFPMTSLFASGGQSIGASASVLPVNIQSWFPLRLTNLISLQSKGLSRVFSNTIVQKH